ncbi:hypothetical protein ACQEV4_01390 [Streptomyces shenzhenensis]|uniref:hypothetical protein n=1 Tax=Streptomyces shenzhenensis TaxID=943815 RepID=UPI003D945AF4
MTTSEEIQQGVDAALAKLSPQAPPPRAGAARGSFRVSSDRLDSYTQKALQAECDAIVQAPDGDQNNIINRAAFNVGQLVGAGALGEDEARDMLLSASVAGNHPEGRARPSIDSGLRAGVRSPRNPWPPVSRRDDDASFRNLIADVDDIDWSDLENDVTGGSDSPEPEPPEDAPTAAPDDDPDSVALRGKLPASFYDQREILKRIRQYAHAMTCSADVVLYATLARLSGMIDHNIKVDTGVKKPASLNLFVGVIDGAGSNKTSSCEASEDLLQAPEDRDFQDGRPLGTGEGIAEALMGEKEELDPTKVDRWGKQKVVKVRKQVRHNLFFYQDEGESVIRIGSRDGSSLWPSIRSAWQAGGLGQTNASAERTRFIKRGTYAMGMVIGFQYTNALVVVRDSITGTAQRFVWCPAVDPDIPMDPVPVPEVDFGRPQDLTGEIIMTMPDSVKRAIRTELVLRNSGKLQIDPLDTHANLVKVKLAGLLALLDGARTFITEDDWRLAGEMWAVSCALRTAILERANREEATAAQARREERVKDAVQAHEAVARREARFEVRARWCVKKIREGVRVEQLSEKASSKWRKDVPAGFELALARGWLVETDDGGVEVSPGAP